MADDRRPPAKRRRSAIHYGLMVIGWPLLVAIGTLLVLRWRDVDRVPLVALVALTPFVLGPIAVADVIAWFSRSPMLRVAAAVTTVAGLFTVAPFDAVIGCRPTPVDNEITVMTANVLLGHGRPEDIAANMSEADPDIAIFQEVDRGFMERLAQEPSSDRWPERSNEQPDATGSVVVWSKWPMSDVRFSFIANSLAQATIDAPQGRFDIAGVHVTAPVTPERLDRWHDQHQHLGRIPTDRPTVMAGDFNATEDHRPFRRLLAQGWTDVHDNKGCGPDLTWPANALPHPVMRLDHILVTDHFDVASVELADPAGSDHFPVVAKIQLNDS